MIKPLFYRKKTFISVIKPLKKPLFLKIRVDSLGLVLFDIMYGFIGNKQITFHAYTSTTEFITLTIDDFGGLRCSGA